MFNKSIFRPLLVASCILTIGASAIAAPYWTGYRGTIANSTIPAIRNGENYTVNIIFDNGGNSVSGQSWSGANVKCMVWYMNNDNSVMFVQDLTKPGANFMASGQIATNSSGAMSTMFSRFGTSGLAGAGAGTFVGQGLTGLLTAPYAGVPQTGVPGTVFIAGPSGTYTNNFGDSNLTIPVTPNAWKSVAPFDGWGIQKNPRFAELTGCADPKPVVIPTTATPVPALGAPALALLGLGAAAFGARRLRRRKA